MEKKVEELKNNDVPSVEEQKNLNNTKDKPVGKVRSGRITISIWKNQKEKPDGKREYYTFTIQKSYKDKKGDWHNINSFLMSDLSDIAFACGKVFNKI